MQRPTTRVLAVLERLQSQSRLSGSVLAKAVGVDGRTLRRYVTILEELGIPITTDRGRHGGYSLVPGFKLPPMMFTDDEALALSLGLLAARSLGLEDLGNAVASAQAKLERVMPPNLKRRVRAIDETVSLDVSGSDEAPRSNQALAVLSGAAQSGERVRLRYLAADKGASVREIDPYGLAHRARRWYVVGYCHLRKDLRSFRLDRIEDVRPLGVSFTRPPGFDALGYLAFSAATMPRRHAIEVWLDTDLNTARRELRDTIGVFEPAKRGVSMLAHADDLDWFARQLARLPFRFEVVGPEPLREALRRCGERLQRSAAPPAPSSGAGSRGPSKRRPRRGGSRPRAAGSGSPSADAAPWSRGR